MARPRLTRQPECREWTPYNDGRRCGGPRAVVTCLGGLWLPLASYGQLRLTVASCGLLWLAEAGCGWLQVAKVGQGLATAWPGMAKSVESMA